VQTAEQHRKTEVFIRSLRNQPGNEPELLASLWTLPPKENNSAPSPELDDPLLDLLRNHESLSEEMFLETLQSQRGRSWRHSNLSFMIFVVFVAVIVFSFVNPSLP
jgi:hypothetical protein